MRHFRLPFPLPCLVLAATLQAGCDATIHEYPTAQTSQVIVELNADRMPPDYYKELVYDKDGNHTEKLLEQAALLRARRTLQGAGMGGLCTLQRAE